MNKLQIVKSFVENMEIERYRLGYTQAEMALKLDMSPSAYRKIINGETRNIGIHTICQMHKLTNKFLFELIGVNHEYSHIIKTYREMSQRQRNFISCVAKFESEFATHPERNDEIDVVVPTGNCEDGMIWDSVHIEKTYIANRLHGLPEVNYGLKITSNHLHPVYAMDDILLIETRSPRDGDTGVFLNKISHRAYIRKFKQTDPCQMIPINGYGKTFYVNPHNIDEMSDWVKLGRVICRLR